MKKCGEMLEKFYVPALEERANQYEKVLKGIESAMRRCKKGCVFYYDVKGNKPEINVQHKYIPMNARHYIMERLKEDGFAFKYDRKKITLKWTK